MATAATMEAVVLKKAKMEKKMKSIVAAAKAAKNETKANLILVVKAKPTEATRVKTRTMARAMIMSLVKLNVTAKNRL